MSIRIRHAVLLMLAATCCACDRSPAEHPRQLIRLLGGPSPRILPDLATYYNASIPSIRASVEPSPSVMNIVLALQEGRGDVGVAQADVVYTVYRRGSEQNPQPFTNLRGIGVLSISKVYVIVRRDSTLRSIKDLGGAHIGLGPVETSELFTHILLDAYGIRYSAVRTEFQPVDTIVEKLERRTLDVAIIATPLIESVWSTRALDVRLLPVSHDITNQIRLRYPFIKPVVLPAGTFPGQHEDVPSVGADALLICRKDLSEDVVYQLTKGLFAAPLSLLTKLAPTAVIDPDEALTTPIPLHPGAARYYREREILQ